LNHQAASKHLPGDTVIYVVIPTFNRTRQLIACLRCLASQTVENTPVICDSGTSVETSNAVKSEYSDVELLKGDADLWWTGSINLGLRHVVQMAKPEDHILFLNDDTLFDETYLEALMACARQNPESMIGSVCVDQTDPDVIIDGGIIFNWYSAHMRQLNIGLSLSDFDPGYTEKVSVLPGRGTLFSAAVIDRIGLPLEDKLPHYGADYEYTRSAARAGYTLFVSYDAVIRSDVSTTGQHRREAEISLSGARDYFFGRKSSGNLVDRFRFSYRATENPIAGTVFFMCSTARLVNRYLAYRG
jgi:GT2 family glycosyltransferase